VVKKMLPRKGSCSPCRHGAWRRTHTLLITEEPTKGTQMTNDPIRDDQELARTLSNLLNEAGRERMTGEEWLALCRSRGYVLVLAEDWKSLTDDDLDLDEEESVYSSSIPKSDPSREFPSCRDYLNVIKSLGYDQLSSN